jgi:mRNA interferase MazF
MNFASGDIVLFKFPLTNQATGKRRPAVLLKKIPGQTGDWLVCMVSSRLHHEIQGLDLVVRPADASFTMTGLRKESLIRATRLAVVDEAIFEAKIGNLPEGFLLTLQQRLADWLLPR